MLSNAEVMSFLNEVADEFPAAVSFAAGRPADKFLERLDPAALLNAYNGYDKFTNSGSDTCRSTSRLLQYGRTGGIVTDLVAHQLREDDNVPAAPERMVITSGCQEALALCLTALCQGPTDAVLVRNPTYAGAMGAVDASKLFLYPIPLNNDDLAEGIEKATAELKRVGRRPRVLYLIPNFDNPTGRVIDESQRRMILEICAKHSIIVLEDNPYGMFRYEGLSITPLAALDKVGCVIYLSTFSKTLAPALRVGALTLPESFFGNRTAVREIWREIVQRKSFNTLNTSQISQAIVGGILLQQGGSLRQWVRPAVAWYHNSRDMMISALEQAFAPFAESVRWNRPLGGFFLSLELPFSFDERAVRECAVDHGVIVMPMRFFSLDASQDKRIRLSFSSASPEQIVAGIASLADYALNRAASNLRVT
jgi:(S)-3,5-dihydroxyphenylglycine transaminase